MKPNRYSSKRAAILFIWVASACAAASAQEVANEINVGQVRAAFIDRVLKPGERVDVLLRDLSVLEGKVIAYGPDSFDIRVKHSRQLYSDRTIPYKNILRLRSPKRLLAFIPDPTKRPHGEWGDVSGIAQGRWIILRLDSGKEMIGRFGGAGDRSLRLLGHTDDAFIEIPRTSIESVHGYFTGSGGVANGTRAGMKIGTQVPPNPDAAFIGTTVGAGIGAFVGFLNRRPSKTILVYSR